MLFDSFDITVSVFTIYKHSALPLMATLLVFMEVSTWSSFSSLAMFCTSLRWNSSNSTGMSAACRQGERERDGNC